MKTHSATAPAWAPIIDTHAHAFEAGLPLVAGATNRPSYDFTAQNYVATLDREGVLFGVMTAPSFFGTFNDLTIAALATHRRLRATVMVDPEIDPYALRAMDGAGVVGVRFSLRNYPVLPDLSALKWQQLLRRVRDLDWYVHLLAESERNAILIPILDAAGVKIVIDHFGVPERLPLSTDPGFAATLRAVQNGRTWVKLSAPYRRVGMDVQLVTDTLLAEAGTERLLWGSDCPWVGHEGQFSYRDTIDWFEQTVPDRAVREAIGRTGLALNRFI